MNNLEIYEISPGVFGIRGCGQMQDFDPEQPGFEPMSEARAIEVLALMTAQMASAE
jgi:hypothetical protein